MKVIKRKLDDIIPYPKNAKNHNVDWIINSILIGTGLTKEDVQNMSDKEREKVIKPDQPIVIWEEDNMIIKGHGRLKAAYELNMKAFPVVIRDDLTEEQVRLARIVDNRSGESDWDLDLLNEEVEKLSDNFTIEELSEYGIDEEWEMIDFNFNNEDEDEDEDEEINYIEEWEGMPECENEDLGAKFSITVNFLSIDDLNSFATFIDQKITEKTRSIWYPEAKKIDMTTEYYDEK